MKNQNEMTPDSLTALVLEKILAITGVNPLSILPEYRFERDLMMSHTELMLLHHHVSYELNLSLPEHPQLRESSIAEFTDWIYETLNSEKKAA